MRSATEQPEHQTKAGQAEPAVSVIIVNYNAGDRLLRCLEHLGAQTFRDFETIIIDNGSEDRSLQDAQNSTAVNLRLIEAGENLGFAAANNRAAEVARGEWLALLNPDAYAEPDWLAALMKATQTFPQVDAFGSTQLDASDPTVLDGAGDVYSVFGINYRGFLGWPADMTPADGESFAPCAAAAFYRRSRFLEIGGFDERFFCYGEDVDFGFRLRLWGGCAVQVRDAVVRHEGSGLTGRKSDFALYHGHRNRIWLAYKNTPPMLYWMTAPLRYTANAALLVMATVTGHGRAVLKGLRDGYGGLARFREDRKALGAAARSADIAPMLVWSPWRILRRQGKVWPLPPANGES